MQMLSPRALSERLQKENPGCALSEGAIRHLAKDGKIPSLLIGKRHRLICYEAVKKFVENGGNQS